MNIGDRIGQSKEIVGGFTHGGDDNNNVISVATGEGHVVGHGLNAVGIRNGRAAVFLNN